MALPQSLEADLVSYSPSFHCAGQHPCNVKAAAAGGFGEVSFGGQRSSLSCCEVASPDSENDSSFLWHDGGAMKCEEDTCGAMHNTGMRLLHCDDESLDDEEEDEDATREWAPGRPASLVSGSIYHHSDAEEVLSNELSKEAELGPFTTTPIPAEYRSVLAQWMRDVCAVRSLSPATFFSSLSLLDRFIRATGEGATPPSLLQLVALTCVAVAAKSEQQQCAGELVTLARDENGNLYKAEDLRMMELHLLDILDWRLRMPTLYTLVSLLLHRVINRPEDGRVVPLGAERRFQQLVMSLAELAALDYDLTGVSYSVLAVACLLVAETVIKGGHDKADLKTVQAMRAVPGLQHQLSKLTEPVHRLYCLYQSAVPGSSP